MKQLSLWEELGFLLLKIILLGGIVLFLFTFVFRITLCSDDSMNPAVKEGDLVISYQLQKEYQAGDVIVIRQKGKKQVRRVAAIEGDTVDITQNGLMINGYLQQENGIYTETLPYKKGISFPLTVKEGEVFVLGDNREIAEDSRIYGPMNRKESLGKVITILRRRNL